jgi:hypothetical protein
MEAASTTPGNVIQPHVTGSTALKVWIERLLFASLFLLFVFRGFLPAWSHLDSDFADYYLAAHVYHEGYPAERVYEWTWFQRQKDHFGVDRPLVGLAPWTMTSALLVLPLTALPPLTANRCWLAISFVLLLLAGFALKKITRLSSLRVGVIAFLAVAPLHDNFLLGQVHVALLLLITIAAWLYFGDRPFLCGVVLAVAAALRIYPALFLLFFVTKKQWRAAAGFLCGFAGALLASAGLFGAAGCRTYLREILPLLLRGEIINPYSTDWDSLTAFLRRLFIFEPELNAAPIAHAPHLYAFLHSLSYAVILVAFFWAIASWDGSLLRAKLEWASCCFLMLFVWPAPRSDDFIVLILAVVLVVDYLLAREKFVWAMTMLVVYALVCTPYSRLYHANLTGWVSAFCFPRLFWMLVLAGILLWLLISSSGRNLRDALKSYSFARAAIAFLILFAAGFVLDVRHIAGQFDNYATRITTSAGPAIATDPIVTETGIFYGGLLPRFGAKGDAYSIYRLQSGSITSFGGSRDWFHPAATPDGRNSWVEVASVIKSRIVKFEAAETASDDGDTRIVAEVDDGEQPVVSADGRWLAYIRETGGRGSLWIRPLGGTLPEPTSSVEHQIAGHQYDVRDVAFSPDGQFFFSSWQATQYRLFSVDSRSGIIAPLTSPDCSARYPAFSPDRQWMAFSCERHGAWQLTTMNLMTGEKKQLTTADCNSITPAWALDSKSLIYATDCGRGLGLTALSRIKVVH